MADTVLTQADKNIIIDVIKSRILVLQSIEINTDSLDKIIEKLSQNNNV